MKAVAKKKFTSFRPVLFSRHPTHQVLRGNLPLFKFRSVIRLGSTTDARDSITNGGRRIEINTMEGVRNSASKLRMKTKFTQAGVKTADWWTWDNAGQIFIKNNIGEQGTSRVDMPYPLVAKHIYGSRGTGNYLLKTKDDFDAWSRGKEFNNYIFEKFIKMSREYRLHITSGGCFYTCRKLLKNDAPEGTWQRHDDVCTWVVENNPSFKKPRNWDTIVADCIKAKDALGLDICAFDVMVQGSRDGQERENPEWNICESCSAPSFGEITAQKYIEELPKVLTAKFNRVNA